MHCLFILQRISAVIKNAFSYTINVVNLLEVYFIFIFSHYTFLYSNVSSIQYPKWYNCLLVFVSSFANWLLPRNFIFSSNKLKWKHLLSSTMLQIFFYRIFPGFFLRVSLFVLYMHSTYTYVFKHETMYSNFSVVFCSRTMRVKKLYGLVEKKGTGFLPKVESYCFLWFVSMLVLLVLLLLLQLLL